MAVTRRVLERVPEAAFAWKPHEKAFGLGGLATHLAQLPHWGTAILERDELRSRRDGNGQPAERRARAPKSSSRSIATSPRCGAVSSNCTEAELAAPWTLKRGGRVVMSLPRASRFRSFLLSHLIHHRGQLTVYLRMQNVPLPPHLRPDGRRAM